MDSSQFEEVISLLERLVLYLEPGSIPWDRITGIAAIFVALVALCVSVWHGWLTRRHNRISVTPSLSIFYAEGTGSQYRVGINLVNTGLGPSTIVKLSIYVDNELLSSSGNFLDVVEKLEFQRYPVTHHWFSEKASIQAGMIVPLLTISDKFFNSDNTHQNAKKFLEAIKNRFGMVIQYESMYGEPQESRWGRIPVEKPKANSGNGNRCLSAKLPN